MSDSQDPQPSPSLLVRFRAGERAAFVSVYDLFADKIRAVARKFFATAFDQEEAIQEIWIMVHRQCAQFDLEKGDLGGWLWTLATNRCKELWRSRSRRPDLHKPVQVDDDSYEEFPALPDVQVQNKRLADAMEMFCTTLSANHAQVFRLSCLQERSYEDVAALTGMSPRQCKYLRMKLLQQAALDPGLQRALQEVKQP